jgi:hypothetical protein
MFLNPKWFCAKLCIGGIADIGNESMWMAKAHRIVRVFKDWRGKEGKIYIYGSVRIEFLTLDNLTHFPNTISRRIYILIIVCVTK